VFDVEVESKLSRFWMSLRRDQFAHEDQVGARDKVRKDVIEARVEIITQVEEENAVAREEGGLELKERGVPLAVRILAHGDSAFAGHDLWPCHAAGPLQRPYHRLHGEEEKHGAFARALPDAGGAVHLRVPLLNLDLDLDLEVEPHYNLGKVVGEAEPPQHSEKRLSQSRFKSLGEVDKQRPRF
jgi:hypothetical protein